MRLRNRTVKAEFWADLKLRGLDHAFKLVYIGLWQACDDAGYGTWEPSELAALLFPYDPPEAREPLIIGAFAELRERGLIKVMRCGHFTIPSLPKHVYSSEGKRTSQTRRAHEAGDCPKPTRRRGTPETAAAGRGLPARDGSVRDGMGRDGRDARAHEASNGSAEAHSVSAEELRALIADPASTEPARKAARKALERIGETE